MQQLADVCPKNTEGFLREFTWFCELLNEAVVWHMDKRQFEKAAEVIDKILEFLQSQPFLFLESILLIRNTQACMWKTVGQPRKALQYLRKAENLLGQHEDVANSLTFLNLALLYTGMHE